MRELLILNGKESLDNFVKNIELYNLLTQSKDAYSENSSGSRAENLETLLKMAEKAVKKIGVDELVDITYVDDVDIPVYSISPQIKDERIINCFNGKGHTKEQARASAYMEFIERISARNFKETKIKCSYNDLSKLIKDSIVKPNSLITYNKEVITNDLVLNWTWGINITKFKPVLIPAVAVNHPYFDNNEKLFCNSSNGPSSGSNVLEAILQGITEVIERDCVSLSIAGKKMRDVDINSINSKICSDMIKKFIDNDINISVKDVTNELGIPCFAVTGDDRKNKTSYLLSAGYGCHTNKEIALLRALTELAQTRRAILYGKREDIHLMRSGDGSDYEDIKNKYINWYSTACQNLTDFSKISSIKFENLRDELYYLINILEKFNLDIIVSNLTMDEIEIPVVRVIIPGMENWYKDKQRYGKRIYNVLNNNKIGG